MGTRTPRRAAWEDASETGSAPVSVNQ